MKQLILYFLFFVCAAFILIQCARYFPSNDKIHQRHSPTGKINNQLQNKSPNSRSPGLTDVRRAQFSLKPSFSLNFTGQAFPLSMVKYINHYPFLIHQYWSINENKFAKWQLFYNPYPSFSLTDLFNKRDSGLIANNPFDGKR